MPIVNIVYFIKTANIIEKLRKVYPMLYKPTLKNRKKLL